MRPLMALLHPFPSWDALDDVSPAFDEIADLTDRRCVLLRTIFGVRVGRSAADEIFTPTETATPR